MDESKGHGGTEGRATRATAGGGEDASQGRETLLHDVCAICQEVLGSAGSDDRCSDTISETQCHHYFCTSCIFRWLGCGEPHERGCPLCKCQPLSVVHVYRAAAVIDDGTRDGEGKVEAVFTMTRLAPADATTVLTPFHDNLSAARARACRQRLAERVAQDALVAAELQQVDRHHSDAAAPTRLPIPFAHFFLNDIPRSASLMDTDGFMIRRVFIARFTINND